MSTYFRHTHDANNQLVTLKIDEFETKALLLLHPCLRKSNIRFRSYNGTAGSKGLDIEIKMMKDFLQKTNLSN